MIRRIVCLLLVPALLTNQAALCCAHSHHDSGSSDHSSRSHFHVSGPSHKTNAKDHQHGDGGEHEHDHEHTGEPVSDDTDSKLASVLTCPVDHDSNAIFFGEHNNINIPSSRITLENLPFIAVCFVAELPRIEARDYRTQAPRAGPFSPHYCDIYLQTGCLLI